jgi:hypothetical protein
MLHAMERKVNQAQSVILSKNHEYVRLAPGWFADKGAHTTVRALFIFKWMLLLVCYTADETHDDSAEERAPEIGYGESADILPNNPQKEAVYHQ